MAANRHAQTTTAAMKAVEPLTKGNAACTAALKMRAHPTSTSGRRARSPTRPHAPAAKNHARAAMASMSVVTVSRGSPSTCRMYNGP